MEMSKTAAIPRPTAVPAETHSDPGEERGVIRGAAWDFYDQLTESLGRNILPFGSLTMEEISRS